MYEKAHLRSDFRKEYLLGWGSNPRKWDKRWRNMWQWKPVRNIRVELQIFDFRCIHGFMSNLIKKSWTDSTHYPILMLNELLVCNCYWLQIAKNSKKMLKEVRKNSFKYNCYIFCIQLVFFILDKRCLFNGS